MAKARETLERIQTRRDGNASQRHPRLVLITYLISLRHGRRIRPRVSGASRTNVRTASSQIASFDMFYRSYDAGYKEGHAHGTVVGQREGEALGTQAGFELWNELGFYSGFASIWGAILAQQDTTDE